MSKDKLPNQEDITLLSEIKSTYNCFDEQQRPYYHALGKAIQVLRAEGDLISREALREQIEDSIAEYGDTYSTDLLNGLGMILQMINEAPTADAYSTEDVREIKQAVRGATIVEVQSSQDEIVRKYERIEYIVAHWNDERSNFVAACEAFEEILDVLKAGAE